MKKIIVWFRQDLRLIDNPALFHAAQEGQIIPLYIYDQEDKNIRALGGASKWWLHNSLTHLDQSLKEIKSTLILKQGSAFNILEKLVAEENIEGLYWNRCYEPYAIKRDQQIKEAFTQKNIDVQNFNGNLLFEPWEIKNKQGGFYKVFSAFWRQCLENELPFREFPIPALKNQASSIDSDKLEDWDLLPKKPNWAKDFKNHWQIGEKAALKKLENFLEHKIQFYAQYRDIPEKKSTTTLSPHLHFGEISPRTIIYHLNNLEKTNPILQQNINKLKSEIGWREFSYSLLYYYPTLMESPLNKKFDKFDWQNDAGLLEKWQKGLTGYPLIDAGMRELWKTGYMHNRVRMVVASFLTKHLLIHWAEGEKWFWDTLVDADLANNSASWQWVAGSGADAAPYFRIFNPITQSEKFDPNGIYIRQWVPELSDLPNKYIHTPWKTPEPILKKAHIKLGVTYPTPIIDHHFARERALETYKKL